MWTNPGFSRGGKTALGKNNDKISNLNFSFYYLVYSFKFHFWGLY